jgi:hypothetical protein
VESLAVETVVSDRELFDVPATPVAEALRRAAAAQ